MFLATNGERLGATWLTGQVHHYIDASEVGKSGSCHLFRHTAATLMVEGGADIRYVQELLGHRDLSSTHIYTRVAPERLAAIHAATHPGAVLPTGTCAAGRHQDCPAVAGIPCGCPCHDPAPEGVQVTRQGPATAGAPLRLPGLRPAHRRHHPLPLVPRGRRHLPRAAPPPPARGTPCPGRAAVHYRRLALVPGAGGAGTSSPPTRGARP